VSHDGQHSCPLKLCGASLSNVAADENPSDDLSFLIPHRRTTNVHLKLAFISRVHPDIDGLGTIQYFLEITPLPMDACRYVSSTCQDVPACPYRFFRHGESRAVGQTALPNLEWLHACMSNHVLKTARRRRANPVESAGATRLRAEQCLLEIPGSEKEWKSRSLKVHREFGQKKVAKPSLVCFIRFVVVVGAQWGPFINRRSSFHPVFMRSAEQRSDCFAKRLFEF